MSSLTIKRAPDYHWLVEHPHNFKSGNNSISDKHYSHDAPSHYVQASEMPVMIRPNTGRNAAQLRTEIREPNSFPPAGETIQKADPAVLLIVSASLYVTYQIIKSASLSAKANECWKSIEGKTQTIFGEEKVIPVEMTQDSLMALKRLRDFAPKIIESNSAEVLWLAKLISERYFDKLIRPEHVFQAAHLKCGICIDKDLAKGFKIDDGVPDFAYLWKGHEPARAIRRDMENLAKFEIKHDDDWITVFGRKKIREAWWIYSAYTLHKDSFIGDRFRNYATGPSGNISGIPMRALLPAAYAYHYHRMRADAVSSQIEIDTEGYFTNFNATIKDRFQRMGIVSHILEQWDGLTSDDRELMRNNVYPRYFIADPSPEPANATTSLPKEWVSLMIGAHMAYSSTVNQMLISKGIA